MFRFGAESEVASFVNEETRPERGWCFDSPGVPSDERKRAGAYYTDPTVARFLVRWAIGSAASSVLEPCFGGGVFLQAALDRLKDLGATTAVVTGIEADVHAFEATRARLIRSLSSVHLLRADFFAIDPAQIRPHSAVIGNPPFIRYHRFNGSGRVRSLARAASRGVELTRLTSSWAPFVVHATSFLEDGGRLAMVAPAELCHAVYARPVLSFLSGTFRRVRILTFGRKLFPQLNEDTVLILAEGYGCAGNDLNLISLPDASALTTEVLVDHAHTPVDVRSSKGAPERFAKYLLPPKTRELYERLGHHPKVVRLGAMASVGIGYVTGGNEFFHLTADDARVWRIPDKLMRRAVCRASWLSGVRFTHNDWDNLDHSRLRTRLLDLSSQEEFPDGLRAYLRFGKRRGVHNAYKCRVRSRWYAVPGVQETDLFLTYMANERPSLVINDAAAVAPNTLLCVRLIDADRACGAGLASAWWTSLAAISAEIEGHSLGGGMLKLEPRESQNLLMPMASFTRSPVGADLLREIDNLVRKGAIADALDLGDRCVLRRELGLSVADCTMLREGFRSLCDRRRRR